MVSPWRQQRRSHPPRPAILQSSAVGLIHFPTPSIHAADAPGEPRSRFRAFRPGPRPGEAADPDDDPVPHDASPAADPAHRRRIVVGVTHDPASRNALRWAARSALADRATLVVVTAYNVPCPVPTMYGWAYVDEQVTADAARFMQRNVLYEELRGQELTERVRAVVTRGDTAAALVAAAKGADLLVIGHRDRRTRLAIRRSISRSCFARAQCPVVVVRDDLREEPLPFRSVESLLAPADDRPVAGVHPHRERTRPRFEFRHYAG